MRLLIEPSEKELFPSLSDDHPRRLPELQIGDILPLSVALINRASNQFNGNVFIPVSEIDGYEVRVAIGGFSSPTSGTFPVTYSSETADERLSYDPTAEELESALNSISTVDSGGGVDVTGADGFFTITWREDGVRSAIEADASDLVPSSIIEIETVIPGNPTTREVQTLRIRQDVGAIAELTDDSDDPEITVTIATQGGSGDNHVVRLTFPPDRWGGRWTFEARGGTSGWIPHSATQEQIQTALEAIAEIGAGNVAVYQEDENNYLVMFQNALGLQDITGIDANGENLSIIATKSGSLDLTDPRVGFLIPAGESNVLTTLEVEATPQSGDPEKVLSRSVILKRGIITPE